MSPLDGTESNHQGQLHQEGFFHIIFFFVHLFSSFFFNWKWILLKNFNQ